MSLLLFCHHCKWKFKCLSFQIIIIKSRNIQYQYAAAVVIHICKLIICQHNLWRKSYSFLNFRFYSFHNFFTQQGKNKFLSRIFTYEWEKLGIFSLKSKKIDRMGLKYLPYLIIKSWNDLFSCLTIVKSIYALGSQILKSQFISFMINISIKWWWNICKQIINDR